MHASVAGDVVEMRTAIAEEKGDAEPWDLKNAAGGLIDIEFIAQYLQLVHAASAPEILDTSTARMLEKAARAGVLKPEDAAVLRPAVFAVPRPHADIAALPARRVRSEIGECRGAGAIGARGRSAGIPGSSGACRGNPASGAGMFVGILAHLMAGLAIGNKLSAAAG